MSTHNTKPGFLEEMADSEPGEWTVQYKPGTPLIQILRKCWILCTRTRARTHTHTHTHTHTCWGQVKGEQEPTEKAPNGQS